MDVAIAIPDDDDDLAASTMQLVEAETLRRRSIQFWCLRFLALVAIISLVEIILILLFPALQHFFIAILPFNNNDNSSARPTELGDIYIAVKTTKRFHKTRLALLMDTWIEQAKGQTFIFTDSEDASISDRLNQQSSDADDGRPHFVVTDCPPQHSREALACKMARELAGFYQQASTKDSTRPRWFCHLDDDTYANVPMLVELLASYDHRRDWYLGRPSLDRPMRLPSQPGVEFQFATGGAGFCLSQSLMARLRPFLTDGAFERTSASIRLPDDCTVGYVVEVLAGQRLTRVDALHSHLEYLDQAVTDASLARAVTFSYSKLVDRQSITDNVFDNVVGISRRRAKFSDPAEDPTRLLASHCALFPSLRICQ